MEGTRSVSSGTAGQAFLIFFWEVWELIGAAVATDCEWTGVFRWRLFHAVTVSGSVRPTAPPLHGRPCTQPSIRKIAGYHKRWAVTLKFEAGEYSTQTCCARNSPKGLKTWNKRLDLCVRSQAKPRYQCGTEGLGPLEEGILARGLARFVEVTPKPKMEDRILGPQVFL